MLFIIASRLIAQKIDPEKSHLGKFNRFKLLKSELKPPFLSVIRDITTAVLNQNFLLYLMETFETNILSQTQARVILTDIACSSVMRLDSNSMDKLLDLMIMVYKWQMFLLRSPSDLVKLTFRHLDR